MDKTKFTLNKDSVWYNIDSQEHWTCKKEYFYKLDLLKDYEITWKDFSIIENTTFKYCLIKIE